MKICQTLQKNLALLGIDSNRISFGIYDLIPIVVYLVATSLLFVQFVYVAEAIRQHVESILMISMIIFSLICHFNFKFNTQTIFKMIDELEQTINESELKIFAFVLSITKFSYNHLGVMEKTKHFDSRIKIESHVRKNQSTWRAIE